MLIPYQKKKKKEKRDLSCSRFDWIFIRASHQAGFDTRSFLEGIRGGGRVQTETWALQKTSCNVN